MYLMLLQITQFVLIESKLDSRQLSILTSHILRTKFKLKRNRFIFICLIFIVISKCSFRVKFNTF